MPKHSVNVGCFNRETACVLGDLSQLQSLVSSFVRQGRSSLASVVAVKVRC